MKQRHTGGHKKVLRFVSIHMLACHITRINQTNILRIFTGTRIYLTAGI